MKQNNSLRTRLKWQKVKCGIHIYFFGNEKERHYCFLKVNAVKTT
jgi:hypothetical protein